MIWSLEQLDWVRGHALETATSVLPGPGRLTNDMVVADEKISLLLADKFTNDLAKSGMVTGAGMVIDRRHLRCDRWQGDSGDFWYRMYWMPGTREVQLRGGADDGAVHVVKDLTLPYQVPIVRDVPGGRWVASDVAKVLRTEVATYRLGGWREDPDPVPGARDAAMWVFDLQ
jgi:hypothetical protein